MANFTTSTRFDFEQHEVIEELLEALYILDRPFARSRRASVRRTARRLVRHPREELATRFRVARHHKHHKRTLPGAALDFCALAERVTGQPLTFEDRGDTFLWRNAEREWTYPASRERCLRFGFFTAVDPARWLGAKYTLPGFVDLEENDVVVDCGAFVGGFTLAALRAGAAVVAVEPSRTNRRCLEANLRDSRVDVRPVGLGQTSGLFEFQESSTGVDSTFSGAMDEGRKTDAYKVEMLTVDELWDRLPRPPSLLKVEAEGLELSILRGMRKARPAKLAVDASPEGGHRDRDVIARHLHELGYSVRTDVNMVYARRPAATR